MTESYWNRESDPYQYPNSSVLKNIPDIRDAVALEVFEQRATALRLDEALSAVGDMAINLEAWQAIHRILFQDVYAWSGHIRTVQLAKGKTVFAMPEHIATEAERIFREFAAKDLTAMNHVQFAYFFGELNVLHPFREGNGRTQKLLFDEMARRKGYIIEWAKINTNELLQAVITVFHKQDYVALEHLFKIALLRIA